MAVDDSLRLRIHHKLEQLLGTEEANALVTNTLPAELRGDLRAELAELRGELRSEIHSAGATQTRWMVGFMMSWSVVVLAAARLLF